MDRRTFIRLAGAAGSLPSAMQGAGTPVEIVLAPGYVPEPAVEWALGQLTDALTSRGLQAKRSPSGTALPRNAWQIVLSGAPSQGEPETFRYAAAGPSRIAVSGGDARGAVFALLELADRARHDPDPIASLRTGAETAKPAMKVRGIARLFTSDVHDKPWFNDREMWLHYLTMLAANRYNRFNLSFGIGYDFLQDVTDAYFLFTYPFLLQVPGYQVRVPQLSDRERDANLAMLRYISEQTVARELDFQLGLWMHGYKWLNSPNPNYTIEGLNAENHGPYCRDALRTLLQACPAISGVTFRIHGESGVEEGSFDFWKTVFEGVSGCGRRVRIDMHAKGMNQGMLDLAAATGMPLEVSPKYWAEHMGMPYHQADIREQERPKPGKEGSALMRFSAGSRSFLRYGYGDLLREDRKWSVVTRIWPGTQRLLLWADPVTAAAHAKAFTFCGENGVEICEPLSFKGRRGSGLAGDRCGYADASLRTRWDWQKYEPTYRVWGRLLYNPQADPDQWQRAFRSQWGPAAQPAGLALASASRILPIVTTAYCPSAANNVYWPEIYTNQSIVTVMKGEPYTDTPAPKLFGNAEPLDPQLFSRVNNFADSLLSGERAGRYSPLEVAQWLQDDSIAAEKNLADATAAMKGTASPAFRRLAIDVQLQAGLGLFYAAKLRAGVLYRIYERTGSRTALEEALNQYRQARAAWSAFAEGPARAYVSDITVGEHPQLRGHWRDRLPAMDSDIVNMAQKLETASRNAPDPQTVAAIQEVRSRPQSASLDVRHRPPERFEPGQPLLLDLSIRDHNAAGVLLYYRHVNQAERWEHARMETRDGRYQAAIPALYTKSSYPLQYYFEIQAPAGLAPALYPAFAPNLNNQPYFVARAASLRNS